MKGQKITDTILAGYLYKKEQPYYSSNNYAAYHATQAETKLPVTLKILEQYHPDLPPYLKQIKDCRSESVIKVYETAADDSKLVFITEDARFGNLKSALSRCERLEDSDAIFLSKNILSGHIDLLRNQCNWFGSEEDVEFTQSGIKLSWNNSKSFQKTNPLPSIIQNLCTRPEGTLPFPRNKVMQELIRISSESASEISLNPQMKKKQRLIKKKGRNWFGLKEYKNKNEYYDETVYLAVDEEGFLRVKAYDKGFINEDILSLNKTKNSFTKVIDYYHDGDKTYIVSEYSNDGNLQNYVNKLKGAGVSLSEDQIQFFFFSMFDPLKQIQDSPLKSINMLHIKNIYIENGIPKIGEPIPINPRIEELLKDRAEVPDFYHSNFKNSPSTHRQTYDTYSLGVLLYKLMYTEYPIFPKGKVHIPTTPSYNKRLKTTLEIFLNEGGKLKEIEKRIEVSENVLKQVKENKEKLIIEQESPKLNKKDIKKESKNGSKSKRVLLHDGDSDDEKEVRENKSEKLSEEEEDHINCCSLCCMKLELNANEEAGNRNVQIMALEQSPYKVYRLCTKIVLAVLLYIFLFYFFFLQNTFSLLAGISSLEEYNITIATVTYSVVTSDATGFDTTFGKTSGTTGDLLGMNCLLSNYGENPVNYHEFVNSKSSQWGGYVATGFLAMVMLLGLKVWQMSNFDLIKAWYNLECHKSRFNMSNFVVFHLLWACMLYGHYYFYNYMFNGQTSPCIGASYFYASVSDLFNNPSQFSLVYVSTFCLQILVLILQTIMIGCTQRVTYNKIINPLMLFLPLWITMWVVMRIGVIDGFFYPNMMQDGVVIRKYFSLTNFDTKNIVGVIPEIVVIIELLLGALVDLIYWMFLDKRRRLLIGETSAASLPEI